MSSSQSADSDTSSLETSLLLACAPGIRRALGRGKRTRQDRRDERPDSSEDDEEDDDDDDDLFNNALLVTKNDDSDMGSGTKRKSNGGGRSWDTLSAGGGGDSATKKMRKSSSPSPTRSSPRIKEKLMAAAMTPTPVGKWRKKPALPKSLTKLSEGFSSPAERLL